MNMSTIPSFTSLLDTSHGARPEDGEARREARRQLLCAALPLAIVIALAAAWSAAAPIAGAVVAPAQVKVELNRRTVSHQEGGIVREVRVRDGQKVRAGEPLLIVGNVRSDAELSLLQDQLRAERLRKARAAAEAALEPRFAMPRGLVDDPLAIESLARQQALFSARRRTLDEQIASLQAQIVEARAQVIALTTRALATEAAAQLAAEEMRMNETLVQQGFIQRTRLLALQRDEADYRGRVGEQRGDLAAARQRIAELEARIGQTRNVYQTQASDELKDAGARVRELEERLRPTQDQAERQVVRAPVDGEVMNLRVTAAGQPIGPREPIADVVPADDRLVVEARIRPQDIDHVRAGGAAEVRVDAFDARRQPLLPGRVRFVSADRVTAADGRDAWYVATVEVDAAALAKQPLLRLQAGMPAELFITTGERSLLQYLAEPFGLFTQRALREP